MFIFKREKEIINKCRDYLEEKISFDDFWKLYLEDKMIMKKIRKSAIKNKHGYIDEYSIEDIKKKGQVSFFEKVALQKSIDEYLTYKRIEHYINTEELILYNKWDDVIPSFLDGVVDTYYYLEKIDPEKNIQRNGIKTFFFQHINVKNIHLDGYSFVNGHLTKMTSHAYFYIKTDSQIDMIL